MNLRSDPTIETERLLLRVPHVGERGDGVTKVRDCAICDTCLKRRLLP